MKTIGIGMLLGGGLVVLGALLPWLTLFGGLQTYAGTTGAYGWIMLCAGIVACTIAVVAPRRYSPRTVCTGSAAYGLVILAFAAWLFSGLNAIVERPSAVMFVPQAGPGLYVIVAGAALLVAASLAGAASPTVRES